MGNQENAKHSFGTIKKLLQTLHDQSDYTMPYTPLQFYVRLELKIKKVHLVLKFEQEAGMKPDITLNTTERQQARN